MSLYLGESLISGQTTLVGESRNIGQIIPSTIPLTDAGLHLLDGALIQGDGIYSAFVDYIANIVSIYPDVFTTESDWQSSVTTYGVCGKFVYNSVNNTVRLPKVTGIIEGTTDLTALGDLVEAGLPNITGNIGSMMHYGGATSNNALSVTAQSNNMNCNQGGSWGGSSVSFDASRSSSIYGNSTTVQPQTINVLYYIVIATSTKTDIQVDIDEIATDLNGKADVDLSNLSAGLSNTICTTPATTTSTASSATPAVVVENYVNNNSWYRVYSDGWCEQGGITGGRDVTVTFLKTFANGDYNIVGNTLHSRLGSDYELIINKISTSQARLYIDYGGSPDGSWAAWRACGYLASGQY